MMVDGGVGTGSRLRALLFVLLAFLTLACDGRAEPEAAEAEGVPADTETVALTVYLRTGADEEALLQPVTRDVPVDTNLTMRAVELLLAGPVGDEDLEAPWPEGTEVHSVSVGGGVATVDLSATALSATALSGVEVGDAAAVHLEALALASLANTLTEFPAIQGVRVTVDGESATTSDTVAAFWSGWGMPPLLVRDESLVGEEGSFRGPSFGSYTRDPQTVGVSDADFVHVRSIRVRDRITHIRVVVELADAADHDAAPADVPRSHARSRPDEIMLEVTRVDSLTDDRVPTELDSRFEPYLRDLQIGEGQRPHSVRVSLTPATEGLRETHLYATSSPTRVILEIKK